MVEHLNEISGAASEKYQVQKLPLKREPLYDTKMLNILTKYHLPYFCFVSDVFF